MRAEWNSGDAVIRFDTAPDQTISVLSAKATLSSRRLVPGQSVTASAAGYTNPVEWVVDGMTNADPVTVAFTNPGVHELVLNVGETGSSTLLSREILRVEVLDFAPITAIDAMPAGGVNVGWQAVHGELHRVERCSDVNAATWSSAAPPLVATRSEIRTLTFTNTISSSSYFRVITDRIVPWPDPDPVSP